MNSQQVVELTALCERAEWHLATVIDALQAAGLDRDEAEAYAQFAFADRAQVPGDWAEEYLSDAQWNRLGAAYFHGRPSGEWLIHPTVEHARLVRAEQRVTELTHNDCTQEQMETARRELEERRRELAIVTKQKEEPNP